MAMKRTEKIVPGKKYTFDGNNEILCRPFVVKAVFGRGLNRQVELSRPIRKRRFLRINVFRNHFTPAA